MAAKRSLQDDDTSVGENGGTSGTSVLSESDPDVVPWKRRRRGAYHKPKTTEKAESTCVQSH